MTDETEATEEAAQVETPEVEIPTAEELYDGVEPVEAKEAEPVEAKVEEVKEEKAEEDKTAEAETGDKEEVEAAPAPVPTPEEQIAALTNEVKGLKGAYGAEKEKRQAAEEEVKTIDPIDDPEGFKRSIVEENDVKLRGMQWDMYGNDFVRRNPDNGNVEEKFNELSSGEPWYENKLASIFHASGNKLNPFDIMADLLAEKENGTQGGQVDVAKLTAEITAKVTADLEAKHSNDAKKAKVDEVKANIPDDLSGEASRGDRKAAAFVEPTADKLYN